ncbi:MAG: hypothetical protein C0483_08065 [Pirellula sp.]|nr:hypothetical protein [Pirellula sp.]
MLGKEFSSMTWETNDDIVRWTARAAMACYAAALGCRWSRSSKPVERPLWEKLYVAACAIYLLHVACAFDLLHAWSHRAAYEHTARRTAETIGLDWGGGLYFNYALTLLWTVDALWLLARPHSYRRRAAGYNYAMHGFLIFMALNAVVLFGPPMTRIIGLAVCAVLVAIRLASRPSGAECAPRRKDAKKEPSEEGM